MNSNVIASPPAAADAKLLDALVHASDWLRVVADLALDDDGCEEGAWWSAAEHLAACEVLDALAAHVGVAPPYFRGCRRRD
jgi:hypothetical protein